MFGGDAGSPGRGEGAPAEGELAAAREELAAARRELAAARLEAQGFSQMGHEIRTHLSGVLGISGLLLSTELTPDQRELARRIRVSGEALLSILSDLRDFSRLEANALDVEPVDFDLRRAVEDVGDVLAERARDAGVELVALIRSEVPWMVRGDVARLRQILQSLATFAIRSCPGGDVALRASLAEDGGAAARVRFEVRYAPRPGEQAASGLGGGGLGIAVAKRLVDAMGGEIGAATEPGRGGCFWFVLPLARRGRSTDRGVIPRVDLAGKRALIADDSAAARDAVREMVEMLGMACDAVRDRAEAAAALRAATARGEPYDVVIVDAELPDEPRSAPEPAVHARGLRADEPRSAPEPPGDQLVEAALAAQTHLVPVLPPGAGSPSDASPPLTKPLRAALLHARLLSLLAARPDRVPAGARAAAAPVRRATPALESSRSGRPAARSGSYEAVRADSNRPAAPGAVDPISRSHQRLQRVHASARDVIAEVTRLIVEDAPARLAAIREAAARGDMGELSRLARELHEATAALGLPHLSDLAARLERQARAGTPEGAADAASAIEQEVERARAALSRDLGRGGSL